ncbi:MAG: hypothetical protein V4710_05360 [Verrucomicrobiota bacterium]
MSLTIEPQHGIRLELGHYSRIRSYQGGGEFWEHDNQQVLMQYLGEFLPRAIVNEGNKEGTVLFSYLIDGKEALSQSIALGSDGRRAPLEQLNRLREVIARLKARENDPLIDPNVHKLIQAFRLPDPKKDPELYRLTSDAKRLFVLWGVEKEHDSALMPQAAIVQLPGAAGSPAWRKWLPGLLLLLLLLVLGWWLWDRSQQPPPMGSTAALFDSSDPAETFVPETTPLQSAQPVIPNAATPGAPTNLPVETFPDSSPPSPGLPSSPPAAAAPLPAKTPDSLPRSVPAAAATVPSSDEAPVSPALPISAPPKEPDVSEIPPAVQERAGTPPGPAPKPVPKKPAPVPARQKSSEKPSPGSPAKPAALPAEPSAEPPSQPGIEPPAEAPSKTEEPFTDPETSMPPDTAAPASEPAAPPAGERMKLEIINSRTGEEPRNGKVEIVLTAVGRDSKGELVPINAVKRWTINGVPQKGATGTLTTSTALPVSLKKGTHKCTVEGSDQSGRPVKAEAEVDVGIQVSEKPEVKVRPRKEAGSGRATP